MTHIVMAFIAFLLVLPLLIYLPIGLTMKGKLIIALQCLAVAIGAILLFPYVPIWQTGLFVFLVLFLAGYFTLKYSTVNGAVDSGTGWEEEHEREFTIIEPLREEVKQPYEMPVMDEVEEVTETDEPAVPASVSVKYEDDDDLESLFYSEQDNESEMDPLSVPDEETQYLEELFSEADDSDEDTDIPLLHFDDKEKS